VTSLKAYSIPIAISLVSILFLLATLNFSCAMYNSDNLFSRSKQLLEKGDVRRGLRLLLEVLRSGDNPYPALRIIGNYLTAKGLVEEGKEFSDFSTRGEKPKEGVMSLNPTTGFIDGSPAGGGVSIDSRLNNNSASNQPVGDQKVAPLFCTYFDKRYGSRGIVMLRSLLGVYSHSRILVLALDADVAELVRVACPSALVVSLDELCQHDPDFKSSRENRSQIEWYFTATASLMHFSILKHVPAGGWLVYVDADLYFYNPIDPLFKEIGSGSIQIIEHRFPDSLSRLYANGRFNVGWIAVRNDANGLEVLRDYRLDCIDWCKDIVDGPRFADQKYLDYWPNLYDGVTICSNLGANVAPWNISNYSFSYVGGRPRVGQTDVLFYHFHGLKRTEDGRFHVTGGYPLPNTQDFQEFYLDYCRQIKDVEMEFGGLLSTVYPGLERTR
jgi:hypothetical protein